jgi:hypothetical protein
MSRFSRKAGEEVPDKHSDNADRRTVPGDLKPRSPARIEALYAKGKRTPDMGSQNNAAQKNQMPEDRHSPNYDNDVPEGSWLRGGGEGHRLNMDTGKLDPSSKPPKPASGLRASGQDIKASPFSKANKTYGEG